MSHPGVWIGMMMAVMRVVAQPTPGWEESFPRSGEPGVLKIDDVNLAMEVVGDDGKTVRLTVTGCDRHPPVFTTTPAGNVLTIRFVTCTERRRVVLKVPRRTHLHLATKGGGRIAVTGVDGDHEVINNHGDILMREIGGSVVATVNTGNVDVDFRQVDSRRAMSFIAYRGHVKLAVPRGTGADLRLNLAEGRLISDLPIKEKGREGKEVEKRLAAGGPIWEFNINGGDLTLVYSTK